MRASGIYVCTSFKFPDSKGPPKKKSGRLSYYSMGFPQVGAWIETSKSVRCPSVRHLQQCRDRHSQLPVPVGRNED